MDVMGPNGLGLLFRYVSWWKDSPAKFPWPWGKLEAQKDVFCFSSCRYFHTIFKYHADIREGSLNLKRASYIQPSKNWYFPLWRTVHHESTENKKNKKTLKKKKGGKKITSKRIKQCSQLCTGLEGQERSVNSQLWQLQNNYPSSEHLVLQLPGFPQESSSVLVQIGKRWIYLVRIRPNWRQRWGSWSMSVPGVCSSRGCSS